MLVLPKPQQETGQFPSHHGLIQNGYELRPDQATLSKLLQEAGYETAAFLSNMCQANHQGWDTFSCAGGSDEKINRESVAWAESRDRDRPFFLWTHFFGPHGPYYNGGDLAQRLDPGYEGPVAPKKGVLNRIMVHLSNMGI